MTALNDNQFIKWRPETHEYLCLGAWDLTNLVKIKSQLKKITWPKTGNVIIRSDTITKMDSAGAWLLNYLQKKLQAAKVSVQLQNFSQQQQTLLSLINKQIAIQKAISPRQKLNWVARIGQLTVEQLKEARGFLSFTGQLAVDSLRTLRHPSHIRWPDIAGVIYKTGYEALFIVALLSFMIGVVIAYQMGNQLRNYGANVFIVDLLGLSVLREFGPLLTAIIIAGRTGSAFTAQLGIMKINQEVDALNTMGITPADLLLLPRVIGLFIALPLLTMWSDIFGVIGGMVMANNMLNISWYDFLQRFEYAIPLRTLVIGLGKAPVFALIISSIGCFQGMEVHGSAESVGKRTTRSVVLAIFFIIIVDAIFSILFSKFNL